MTEKEILFQIIDREVKNILGSINPGLSLFSNMLSSHIKNYVEPYFDAFSPGGKLNSNAAGAFIKEEVNSKVDEFMKRFSETANGNDDL